jgi:hypothetical protein
VRTWIYGEEQPWAPQDDTERLDGYPSAKNICAKKLAQQEIRHRFFADHGFPHAHPLCWA